MSRGRSVQYSGAITSRGGFGLRISSWRPCGLRIPSGEGEGGHRGHDDVKRLRIIRLAVGPQDRPAHRRQRGMVARRGRADRSGPGAVRHQRRRAAGGARASRASGGVRKQISAPIMLDESLCGEVDAERAVRGGPATCSTCGCRSAAASCRRLRLAQLAKRHGLGYQLGCQVGETAILSAAGRHFATSVGDLRYVEGSYDRHLVRKALGERAT